jgi:hypothetical protein
LQRHFFEPESQHDTPAAPVAHVPLQSVSAVQDLGAGGAVDAGAAAGNFVSGAGAGSVGDVSSAGTSALFAQAVAIRMAVTANTDLEVAVFTSGTISDEVLKISPDRLTLPFADDRIDHGHL